MFSKNILIKLKLTQVVCTYNTIFYYYLTKSKVEVLDTFCNVFQLDRKYNKIYIFMFTDSIFLHSCFITILLESRLKIKDISFLHLNILLVKCQALNTNILGRENLTQLTEFPWILFECLYRISQDILFECLNRISWDILFENLVYFRTETNIYRAQLSKMKKPIQSRFISASWC